MIAQPVCNLKRAQNIKGQISPNPWVVSRIGFLQHSKDKKEIKLQEDGTILSKGLLRGVETKHMHL